MDNIAREDELEAALAEEGATAVGLATRYSSTGVNFEVDLAPGKPMPESLDRRIETRINENVWAHLDRQLKVLIVHYTDQN